jgi:hypothetical protein
MHCIQLDFPHPDTPAKVLAYQIKTAYLLSDSFNCIGTTAFLIYFKDHFDSISLNRKVKIVSKNPDLDPDVQEAFDIYFANQKKMKGLKHPSNDIFKVHKRIENAIEGMVNIWRDDIYKNTVDAGLEGMIDLCELGVFDLYNVGRNVNDVNTMNLHPKSVLQFQVPENAVRNSIWLMPFVFHHNLFVEKDIVTTPNLIEPNQPYLIKFFEFTNINTLNVTQLVSVKNQLNDNLVAFKEATAIWATKCYAGGGFDFLKESVLPLIDAMQHELDSNLILQHNQSLHKLDKNSLQIYVGEVLPVSLWKYYLHFEVINKEEFDELVNDYNAAPPYLIPVLLFSPFESLQLLTLEAPEQSTETEIMPVKKFINVD